MQYGASIVNTATNELQDNLSSAYSQSKKHKHVVAKKVHFPFCHVRPPGNPARPHVVGGLGWLGFLRRTVSEFSHLQHNTRAIAEMLDYICQMWQSSLLDIILTISTSRSL